LRYPVHEEDSPDNVLGEVHIRDVMHAVETKGLEVDTTAGELAREILVVLGVVNEALGSKFESEDFDTIGGLVFGQLSRVPEVGDEVRLDGYLLTVEEVDGPRVARVVARKEAS
jgi:CBS domain containing-hemolysin-like protein